jgi:hypothetical protein
MIQYSAWYYKWIDMTFFLFVTYHMLKQIEVSLYLIIGQLQNEDLILALEIDWVIME